VTIPPPGRRAGAGPHASRQGSARRATPGTQNAGARPHLKVCRAHVGHASAVRASTLTVTIACTDPGGVFLITTAVATAELYPQEQHGEHVMVAAAVSTVRRIWPLAGVGLAVGLNALWIAALGYVAYLFLPF
jgi:hypothetical protein